MALRDGKDHSIFYGSGVKFRRTYQVPHIFQDEKIQPVHAEFLNPLSGHPGIQMAHAPGMELNDSGAVILNGRRIHIGINIRLHDSDLHFTFEHLNGPAQGGRLPGPRAGHQVEQEYPLFLQFFPKQIRLPVIIRKDALLDLDYPVFFHFFYYSYMINDFAVWDVRTDQATAQVFKM